MNIQENVSLKDKNWFETGGNARFFAEPENEDDFVEALRFAREKNLKIFVFGSGANILVSDDGFDGLVIHPKLLQLEIIHKNQIRAGAGVEIQDLIDFALENGYKGLEEFSGIPGTVGGSVYINIHYYEFLISQFIANARVLNKETLEIETVEVEWLEMGYDKSRLISGDYFVLDTTFKVSEANEVEIAYAKGRRDEIIRHRKSKYPYKGTCGSFFRNFYEDEVSLLVNGRKVIWSAYYLDKIGVKGALQVGGARVSHQHANMIVNTGDATSTDIVNLARKMQEMVMEEFNILLMPECQLIGFSEYPLIKK